MFNHQKYRPSPAFKLSDRSWPDNELRHAPTWCSVDLRDGNQALIEPMSVEQKLEMFDSLVQIGFKQIEIGFPSASQTEYEFTRRLIDEGRIPDDVTVQVLVQARKHLIDKTYDALKGVKQAIVHVYNSTSTIQRERVFKLDKSGIIDIAKQGAQWVLEGAKDHPNTHWGFQYSPESFTGTEVDFAVSVCNEVIEIWQPSPDNKCIINLPATVEMNTPSVFADQIEYMCRHLNRRDSIEVSVHTHNDRGCAVAASEMALLAGADRVEGTILGNGERTGNMDVITLAMNLYSQGINPELNLGEIETHLEVFERCTQLPRHPRHPWVGDLVYTAFSGSHQDAIKKCLDLQQDEQPWQVAYLPIDPADLGRDYEAVIRVNSQSGKGGIAYLLEREFGFKLPRWLQIKFSQVVQQASDKSGKELDAALIYQILWQSYGDSHGIELKQYDIHTADSITKIEAMIKAGSSIVQVNGSGGGALEALTHAYLEQFGTDIKIRNYHEHALQADSSSEAVCYIEAEINGTNVIGVGRSKDVLDAGFKALTAAAGQVIVKPNHEKSTA